MIGKYSPTVSEAYLANQNWFKPGADGIYDDEGYDSYGYNKDDVDRAGNHECDYITSHTDDGDDWIFYLYEDTLDAWSYDANTQKPIQRKK